MLKPRRGLSNAAEHLKMLIERAVREVEPTNIGPRFEETIERLHVSAGGAEGGEDFGADHEVCGAPFG
jgi:hypothetical protein